MVKLNWKWIMMWWATEETVRWFSQVTIIWFSINKSFKQLAKSYEASVSCPTFSSLPFASPSFYHPLTHHTNQHQRLPPTLTLAAIIRGSSARSPVSSTLPWISRSSAQLLRPLSLTLTLSPYFGSAALPLTSPHLLTRVHLPWFSGPCSWCSSIQPTPPMLLPWFKFSTPNLAPGLSTPRLLCLCCP